MYVVVVGNVKDGYTFYGPFKDEDEADEFGRDLSDQYVIVELESP